MNLKFNEVRTRSPIVDASLLLPWLALGWKYLLHLMLSHFPCACIFQPINVIWNTWVLLWLSTLIWKPNACHVPEELCSLWKKVDEDSYTTPEGTQKQLCLFEFCSAGLKVSSGRVTNRMNNTHVALCQPYSRKPLFCSSFLMEKERNVKNKLLYAN